MTRDELDEVWQVLTDREKTVISKRFGLNDEKPQTLESVGKLIGYTRERVRHIQNEALSKLRRAAVDLQKTGVIRPSFFPVREMLIPPEKRQKKPKAKRKLPDKPKALTKPEPPLHTDAERLDWLESEIRVRALYIDYSDIRAWTLQKKTGSGDVIKASNLRRLIDAGMADNQP